MARKQKDVRIKYDTDSMAKQLFAMLVRDSRLTQGINFAENASKAFGQGVKQFRTYEFPTYGLVDIYRFKWNYQLANLFKKYRFQEDLYDDDELLHRTHKAHFETEMFLASLGTPRYTSKLVLQRAREIAKRILGRYDPDWTFEASRFGKKSSIGCPLSLAYIDKKLSDVGAFTGSTQCSKWFVEEYLPGDPLLTRIVSPLLKSKACDLEHDSLNLVEVPKSWKILRGITPLTLLALFYSYGVGDQVEDRLREVGLDIRRLQGKHRKLVKRFSRRRNDDTIGGSHATVDLQAASQSLTSVLLNQVLPREWYNACKKTFCRQLIVGDAETYTSSVLPMGNGLTFPVETLVFYCLTKAIGELTHTEGIYSVYGDDLIYPSKLHPYVARIFPDIGLRINADKSFVRAPFRESCGSDFYRGADVRPFFLPDARHQATATQYAVWLYQVYNGLTRRWNPCEIPWTLRTLIAELSYVLRRPLYRVPLTFPDTSGIKVARPTDIPDQNAIWEPIRVHFADGSRWYCFKYLRMTSLRRAVESVEPYYWLKLAGRDDEVDPYLNWWDTDFSFRHEVPIPDFRWEFVRYRKYKFYGKVKKTPVYEARCSCRPKADIYKTSKTKTGSISDWT